MLPTTQGLSLPMIATKLPPQVVRYCDAALTLVCHLRAGEVFPDLDPFARRLRVRAVMRLATVAKQLGRVPTAREKAEIVGADFDPSEI